MSLRAKAKKKICSQIQSGKSVFHLATLSLHPPLIWNGSSWVLHDTFEEYRPFILQNHLQSKYVWCFLIIGVRSPTLGWEPEATLGWLSSAVLLIILSSTCSVHPSRTHETYCPILGMLTVISWWRDNLPGFSSLSVINQKVSWEDIYAVSQPTFPFVLASISDP